MKKLFSIFLFCFSLLLFSQETINFQELPFKDLLAKAKKENKLIFMDAYAVWCGPCKMMERNIFPQKAVREYFNSNYINARFDMEKGEGPEIASKYGIRSYPSFLFLNGDGEVVLKNLGYMSEDQFLAFAKEAGNSKLKNGSYKDAFAKGEKDPEQLMNMMSLYADSDYDFAKIVSERYFEVKKGQPLNKDEVGLLLYFLKSPSDKNYSIFTARRKEIETLMSPEIYKEFDSNIKVSKIMEGSFDQKSGLINDDYFLKNAIPLIGETEAQTALNRMKVIVYPNTGNFTEYEKAALEYYKNSENFNQEELLKAAWIFSQNITNPTSLKKAAEWAEKSVMGTETVENTYVLASIYAKTGNIENAKTFAEISKNIAESTGKDASMPKKLLETLNK